MRPFSFIDLMLDWLAPDRGNPRCPRCDRRTKAVVVIDIRDTWREVPDYYCNNHQEIRYFVGTGDDDRGLRDVRPVKAVWPEVA